MPSVPSYESIDAPQYADLTQAGAPVAMSPGTSAWFPANERTVVVTTSFSDYSPEWHTGVAVIRDPALDPREDGPLSTRELHLIAATQYADAERPV